MVFGPVLANHEVEKKVEDGEGGLFIIRSRETPAGQELSVLYMDGDGQPVWNSDGISLTPPGHPLLQEARFSRQNELVVVWKDALPAGDEWRAQTLARSGQRLWSDNGILLRDGAADSSQTRLSIGEKGQIDLMWEEVTAEGPHVRVRHWDSHGQLEKETVRRGTLADMPKFLPKSF